MTPVDALLIGENSIHPFDETAPRIVDALGESVTVTTSTALSDLESLDEYDVVVDYVTDNSVTETQIESLRTFVTQGGGYLPLHCAADLTSYIEDGAFQSRAAPVPGLRDLIGGHFLDHPDISTFTVEIVEPDHPVVDGVPDFEVFDEPYQVDCDEASVDVLARMNHPELPEAYPVVWTRSVGEGRLCYSSLGHTEEAFENEHHRRILRNAIQWLVE